MSEMELAPDEGYEEGGEEFASDEAVVSEDFTDEGGDDGGDEGISIEEKASLMGWYADHPAGLSAEQFVERTENHLGIARKENKKLWGMVEDLKNEVKQSNAAQAQIAKFLESREAKARQAGYDQAIAQQRRRMEQAVEDADRDAFNDAAAKIDAYEKRKQEDKVDPILEQKDAAREAIQADIASHRDANPELFDTAFKRQTWQQALMAAGKEGADFQQALKEADAAVRQMFGVKRNMPGPSGEGGRKAGGARKLSQIPGAQQAYNQLKRKIPDLTVEEYLAEIQG